MTKKKNDENLPATTGGSLITTELAALRDTEALAEVMRANMGESGVGASMSALEKIKVPSGDVPVYVTEDEIDGVNSIKEFEAAVCWFVDRRLWWEESMEDGGGGSPPNCVSTDLRTGVGQPGGDCAACPHNRFGSAPDESLPWCQERRQMFLLRTENKDTVFPSVLSIPPTSLKSVRRYMMSLAGRGLAYFAALHRFSLDTAKNAKGQTYATVKMSLGRRLEPGEVAALKGYAETMTATFTAAADSV